MTLNDTALQKLADWRPAAGRHALMVGEEGLGWAAAVTADRNDELGCLLWEVELRRTTAKGAASLRAWADQAAGRVTGLPEPLKVVEVDEPRDEALLRSSTPKQRGEALYYYEVRLKGTAQATLCRYQASHDSAKPRSQVAAPLTHEALASVIAGLATDE
jgi:hypothetical protein